MKKHAFVLVSEWWFLSAV